jgi:hypothetical protein
MCEALDSIPSTAEKGKKISAFTVCKKYLKIHNYTPSYFPHKNV